MLCVVRPVPRVMRRSSLVVFFVVVRRAVCTQTARGSFFNRNLVGSGPGSPVSCSNKKKSVEFHL